MAKTLKKYNRKMRKSGRRTKVRKHKSKRHVKRRSRKHVKKHVKKHIKKQYGGKDINVYVLKNMSATIIYPIGAKVNTHTILKNDVYFIKKNILENKWHKIEFYIQGNIKEGFIDKDYITTVPLDNRILKFNYIDKDKLRYNTDYHVDNISQEPDLIGNAWVESQEPDLIGNAWVEYESKYKKNNASKYKKNNASKDKRFWNTSLFKSTVQEKKAGPGEDAKEGAKEDAKEGAKEDANEEDAKEAAKNNSQKCSLPHENDDNKYYILYKEHIEKKSEWKTVVVNKTSIKFCGTYMLMPKVKTILIKDIETIELIENKCIIKPYYENSYKFSSDYDNGITAKEFYDKILEYKNEYEKLHENQHGELSRVERVLNYATAAQDSYSDLYWRQKAINDFLSNFYNPP